MLSDKIELVIFDCDGVLVDSEILYTKVEQQSLKEQGIDLSEEEMHREFTGLSYPDMLTIISRRYGIQLPEKYGHDHPEKLDLIFEQELRPISGMDKLLPSIDRPKCVASNSKLTRVSLALKLTELFHHFEDSLFVAEMVERPKPAPDLFLHAADKHGIKPENCLVIEDSSHGVKAARAADMPVIGLAAGSHCYDGHGDLLKSAGAAIVAHNVCEIRALFEDADLLIA